MSIPLKLLQQDIDAARAEAKLAGQKVGYAIDAYAARYKVEFDNDPTWEKGLAVFMTGAAENVIGFAWLKEQLKGTTIRAVGNYSMLTMQWFLTIQVRWGTDEDAIERLAAEIMKVVEHVKPQPKRLDEHLLNPQAGFRIFKVSTDDYGMHGEVELGINLETKRVVLFRNHYGRGEIVKEMPLTVLTAMLRYMQKNFYVSR